MISGRYSKSFFFKHKFWDCILVFSQIKGVWLFWSSKFQFLFLPFWVAFQNKHLVCFQCQRRVTHGGRTINVKYWVSREGRPSQTTQTLRRKTNDTKWCILQKNQVMCSVFWRRKCKMKGFKGYEWKENLANSFGVEKGKVRWNLQFTTIPQGDIRIFNF